MARTKYWDEESRTWKYADSRKGTVNVDLTGVVKSVNGKTPDENGNVEITIPDSSQNGDGLTSTEKNLMLSLFKATAYTADMSATIAKLESLWEQINETHAGTLADPIPYSGNMALVAGLYYSQDGVVYRCTRDTGAPVYNALSELVGLYVEIV